MASYYAHKPSFRRQSAATFDVYHDAGGGNIIRRQIDIGPSGYSGGRHGQLPARGFNGKFTRDLRDTTFGKAKNTSFDPRKGGYINKILGPVGKAQAWANLLIPAGEILFEAWRQAGSPLPGWLSELDWWNGGGGPAEEIPVKQTLPLPDGTYTLIGQSPVVTGEFFAYRWTWEHAASFFDDGGTFHEGVVHEPATIAEWLTNTARPHHPGDGIPSEWSDYGYRIIQGYGDFFGRVFEGGISGPLFDIPAQGGERIGDYVHGEIRIYQISKSPDLPTVKPSEHALYVVNSPTPDEVISITPDPVRFTMPTGMYPYPWPVWVSPRPPHPNDESGYGQAPSTWPPVKSPTDPATPGAPKPPPPYYPAPPTHGERERKYKFKRGLYTAYQLSREALAATTEAKDAVEAIWDALPGSVKSEGNEAKGLPEKFMDIYNNLDKVDWNEAIQNLIENHFEDEAIGRGLGALDRAARRMGLPSGFRFENVAFEAFEWSL